MQTWLLEDFVPCLDRWIANEQPLDDLRLEVTAWVLSRYQDPYHGVRRAEGFENLWFGTVPHSEQPHSRVVTCSYFIYEAERRLRCTSFATLSQPL